MKIAFFTEIRFEGKVPRNHPNLRVPQSWMVALNADHYNLTTKSISEKYNLGIVIIPKNLIDFDLNYIKSKCDKIAFMQEGPHWYFQDYPLDKQVKFFNMLQEMDFLFVHNKSDVKYFEGLTGKNCKVMPSLMIEDSVKNLPTINRKDVIIGGNFCHWYGGFDSYIVAREINCPIFIPSMGRKIEGEEQMPNLSHLPYMNWTDWIKTLNQFKYGVHLMRTHAAGTFALNCAYLGIPCIGYKGLDTQENCHPDLTVELGDLVRAKQLLTKLKSDSNFYTKCSADAKTNYNKYYTENDFNIILNQIIN